MVILFLYIGVGWVLVLLDVVVFIIFTTLHLPNNVTVYFSPSWSKEHFGLQLTLSMTDGGGIIIVTCILHTAHVTCM